MWLRCFFEYESNLRMMNTTYTVVKIRPEKENSGLYRIWTHDLRINDCEYMKIIYVNCRWRNEYESNLHSSNMA